MTTRCASGRSTRIFASASSRCDRPFIGTSALAVVMSRPGTRATCGIGRKISSSAPIGTTVIRSAGTPIWAAMSRRLDSDTVTMRGMLRATSVCIPRKPYQRRSASRRRNDEACARSSSRSTVIGWWIVAETGQPSDIMPTTPRPRLWLSWTRSKSARRARSRRRARSLNAHGSGKPAAHMMANSRMSTVSRNSRTWGTRNGSGERYRSSPGTLTSWAGSSSSGHGCPERTSMVCPMSATSRAT